MKGELKSEMAGRFILQTLEGKGFKLIEEGVNFLKFEDGDRRYEIIIVDRADNEE